MLKLLKLSSKLLAQLLNLNKVRNQRGTKRRPNGRFLVRSLNIIRIYTIMQSSYWSKEGEDDASSVVSCHLRCWVYRPVYWGGNSILQSGALPKVERRWDSDDCNGAWHDRHCALQFADIPVNRSGGGARQTQTRIFWMN